MQNCIVQVKLSYITDLDSSKIVDFALCSSIYEVLPYGYIKYSDDSGKIFAEFNGLSIGSNVKIKITPLILNGNTQSANDTDDGSIIYENFVVVSVENDCAKSSSLYSGNIIIYFGHPWFLLRDVKNHIYPPMNSTELLKKVLEDKTRGISFKIDNNTFDKTDDTGAYARYKVNETDMEFIFNKILPYCAINQRPAHLYSNNYCDFLLRSYENMYKQAPKALFGPSDEDKQYPSILDKIVKMVKKNGIKEDAVYSVSYGNIKIGDLDITAELLPSFAIDNTQQGSVITAGKLPGNKLSGKAGTSFGNLLPMNMIFFANATGSLFKTVRNRQLSDSLAYIFQGSSNLDNMFSIRLDSDFCGDVLSVGDSALIFLPDIDYKNDPSIKGTKVHWINGKWVVNKIIHKMDETYTSKISSTIFLSRPTFVGNDNSTSIANKLLMYEVTS